MSNGRWKGRQVAGEGLYRREEEGCKGMEAKARGGRETVEKGEKLGGGEGGKRMFGRDVGRKGWK